jgi:hypothetical protein
VPNAKELKDKILRGAHESAYSIHFGGNKMYHDLKTTYWWYGMKRDVAEFIALCDTSSESKPSINNLLDYYSRYKCPCGSEKRLPWTSSWICQELRRVMIPFG